MADDDRWSIEAANDSVIVVDDVVYSDPAQRRWVLTYFRNGAVVDAGPAGGEHFVPGRAVALDSVFPTVRCHPQTVDEHDGWLLGGCHSDGPIQDCDIAFSTPGLVGFQVLRRESREIVVRTQGEWCCWRGSNIYCLAHQRYRGLHSVTVLTHDIGHLFASRVT